MAHKNNIIKAGSAFASGMRGQEKDTHEHAYHPNQAVPQIEDKPEGDQASAEVGGIHEDAVPSLFKSGMRGSEKYDPSKAEGQNPLEKEAANENENEAPKGLPAGSEVIGTSKTHHIVRVPIGKGTTKAVAQ